MTYDTSKKCFHKNIPILAIWQIKDYKKKSDFILRTNFWTYLVSTLKYAQNCPSKTALCNSKSYIKKLQNIS